MSVRNGFSTLNRLLGKKNKDKSLSKSSTNLSLSSNHIDVTLSSHLQTQNRITPLPVATSNAPFEQTFRITVLLPREQLYVARLGAKIKLEKLLELVCENKQLDSEIYEFRHPIDSSQVFSLELTIGSVGLTEIRLCHKSETYDSFNADEIIKLRHQTVGRDSLSSSEFSSRNSKHTKTASPYSSTNSLNSIDSTGMNTNYRTPLSLPSPTSIQSHQQITVTSKLPPVAPARKKRMAPRPPIQNFVADKSNANQVNGTDEEIVFKIPIPRKEYHASTPNLSTFKGLTLAESPEFHQSNQSIDCNGNTNKVQDNNIQTTTNGHLNGKENIENLNYTKSFSKISAKKRPMSMHIINTEMRIPTTPEENEIHLNGKLGSTYGSVQSLNTEYLNGTTESRFRLPEPSPRKKIVVVKKKTVAPAPPPRNLTLPPVATPRVSTSLITNENENCQQKVDTEDLSTTLQQTNNVSKVMLNQSETVEPEISVPFSAKSPPSHFKDFPTPTENDDFFTPMNCENHDTDLANSEGTQTDSGIGEPIPSPTPDSLPSSEASNCDESLKSHFETSSDDDEHIKVYNIKLGKTIKQPVLLEEHKTIENLTEINGDDSKTETKTVINNQDQNSIRSNSPNWTYTIPAPPNFADIDEQTSSVKSESSSTESACGDNIDKIKENVKIFIKERSPVNVQICKADVHYSETDLKENNDDDQLIIKESEIFKKCKPVRKNENEINCKTTKLINETVEKPLIINSDIEDGYHGNKIENFTRCVSPSSTDNKITKTDVLNELNNVISENGIDKIIKKCDENDNIESAGPCNLSNFKITTYNPPLNPVKTFSETNNNNVNDEIVKEDIKIQEDDEKLYRKRTSLTGNSIIPAQFLKQRRSITRSDSFHSTAVQKQEKLSDNNLQNSRSSSFLSLLAAQKFENSVTTTNLTSKFIDTNRNKSSSELSIGESPSLQSLIVMKSILNGRKNSLNNDTETDKVISLYGNQNKTEIIDKNLVNCNGIAPKNSNNINNSQDLLQTNVVVNVNGNLNDNINKNNDNDDDGNEKSDDQPEKKWKYQGPPSINLSTWNERPKIQSVTIKNEGDYIFGGNTKVSTTTSISPLPRSYRNSLPATTISIQQFSDSQANNNTTINTVQKSYKPTPKIPFVRSVEYKKMNSSTICNEKPSTQSEETNSNHNSLNTCGTTMTLGRIPKINRQLCTTVPIVKGFQSLEIDTKYLTNTDQSQSLTTSPQSDNLENNLNTKNNNYRYSYAGGNNIDEKIILNRKINEKENSIPAFAQITLRKTGFKEKICPNNDRMSMPLPAKRLNQLEQKSFEKLEIKLSDQKSNLSNDTTSKAQPPPPIIRSVVTKQNSNGLPTLTTNSAIIEPRDELLAAIRDFKKNELRQLS